MAFHLQHHALSPRHRQGRLRHSRTRLPLRPRTLGFLILQLALIYGILPLYFSHSANGGILSGSIMYLTWWLVGLLPLAYDLLARIDPLPSDAGPQKFIRRAYIIIPWLLIIAHLGFFQWVYRAPFFAADLSPILLGLTIATLRLQTSKIITRSDLATIRTLLPAVAFFLSIPADPVEWFPFGYTIVLNPLPITACFALLTVAYCINLRATLGTTVFLILAALEHFFGPSLSQILEILAKIQDKVLRFLFSLLPQTAITWGILIIIAAFALLALGAYRTLRHPTPKPTSS